MRTLWDYQEEQNKSNEEENELTKEQKVEKERQEILEHVSSFSVDTIRDKVAWVLNHFPEARDSDITLQLKYWETFESDVYNGYSITPKDLYELTRLTTLKRARAKLQNEYKLFQASPEVRQTRGKLTEEEKQKAVEDKPAYPVFTVYMDDSGKNAEFLIVGSIWFLADYFQVHRAISEIRKSRNYKKEFHFKELTQGDLPIYKEVIDVFWKYANTVSFKLVSVPRAGIKNIKDAFADIYYHLIIRGIEHENETGRAPLPRTIQIWIDEEEASKDKIMIANLSDRLKQASKNLFDKQLNLDQIYTVSSKTNAILQIADLLAGSANRILNRPGSSQNQKDELADYIFGHLGIDFDPSKNEQVGDLSVHISL